MTIKFDTVTVCQLREKEYEKDGKSNTVYFASIIENGFLNSVTCSKEFYEKHVSEVRIKPVTINGAMADVRFYQGTAKIKLI